MSTTSPAAVASPSAAPPQPPTSVATPPSGNHQQADGSSAIAYMALGTVSVLLLGFLVLVARRVAASRRRAAP
jgi:hypothetical protein